MLSDEQVSRAKHLFNIVAELSDRVAYLFPVGISDILALSGKLPKQLIVLNFEQTVVLYRG